MINKAAVSTLLFRAVSVLFSVILLLLALLSNAELMAVEIEIAESPEDRKEDFYLVSLIVAD